MYPILACSVLVLAVTVERAIFFLRARGDDEGLARRVQSLVAGGAHDKAIELCRGGCSPIAAALARVLENAHLDEDGLERALERESSGLLEEMERHLKLLAVVAQAAPLMGLLGTVTGMIRSFMRVEEAAGAAGAALLAGGIWEALLTTAFGLFTAIPAMLAYHYFEGRVDSAEGKMRRLAGGLAETVRRSPRI